MSIITAGTNLDIKGVPKLEKEQRSCMFTLINDHSASTKLCIETESNTINNHKMESAKTSSVEQANPVLS